jgi:hypothetical protein
MIQTAIGSSYCQKGTFREGTGGRDLDVGFLVEARRWATRNLRRRCAVLLSCCHCVCPDGIVVVVADSGDLLLREGMWVLLLFLHVLYMYIVRNTIGEVYNDDAMTRSASFQLTYSVSMRAKKLEKRQDVAGMDKIVHMLLGDLRQTAWIIHICMCEGSKVVVGNCRVCPAAVQRREMRLRLAWKMPALARVTVEITKRRKGVGVLGVLSGGG